MIGRELVKFVADNSRLLEMYNSEDATMGTWLAGLKVNRKHDTRYRFSVSCFVIFNTVAVGTP